MKVISNAKQATLRTLFILVSMPAVTWAGVQVDSTIALDHTLSLKVLSIFIAALCGGISSTFVQTSFDNGISYPNLFKIFVGACLGTASGLMVIDNFNFGIFSLFLPVFVIATLGAPIMVFYLMWLSNPETQAEIKEQIKQKVREKMGANK